MALRKGVRSDEAVAMLRRFYAQVRVPHACESTFPEIMPLIRLPLVARLDVRHAGKPKCTNATKKNQEAA